jgi:hypothetical protein
MPALSQSQQRLMGQAYALKKGDIQAKDIDAEYRKQIQDLADGMSLKDLRDFAKTKHDDLPVTKESNEINENSTNQEKNELADKIKKLADELDVQYRKETTWRNHCYLRIAYDNAANAKWNTVIKSPFIEFATDKQLKDALSNLKIYKTNKKQLETDNEKSLEFRKKAKNSILKEYDELDENSPIATLSSVNGMGPIALPQGDKIGSGDNPNPSSKKKKAFKNFKDFIKGQTTVRAAF